MRTVIEQLTALKAKDREVFVDAFGNEWMVRMMQGELSLYGVGEKRHCRNSMISNYLAQSIGIPGLERRGVARAAAKVGKKRPRAVEDELSDCSEELMDLSRELEAVKTSRVDMPKLVHRLRLVAGLVFSAAVSPYVQDTKKKGLLRVTTRTKPNKKLALPAARR